MSDERSTDGELKELRSRLALAENLLEQGGLTPQMMAFYGTLQRAHYPFPEMHELSFPVNDRTCVARFVFDNPFESLDRLTEWLSAQQLPTSVELSLSKNRYEIGVGLFYAELFGCAPLADLPEQVVWTPSSGDDDIPF
jgi:hypothetical protein